MPLNKTFQLPRENPYSPLLHNGIISAWERRDGAQSWQCQTTCNWDLGRWLGATLELPVKLLSGEGEGEWAREERGASDWGRNIFFIVREWWREHGMWFILTAWGSPLDSDPTGGEVLCWAQAGHTLIQYGYKAATVQSALLAALKTSLGVKCWGQHVTKKLLCSNVWDRVSSFPGVSSCSGLLLSVIMFLPCHTVCKNWHPTPNISLILQNIYKITKFISYTPSASHFKWNLLFMCEKRHI